MDKVSKEARSKMMAAVRGKNTKPERLVRKALFAAGYRFGLHSKKLPGSPDIALPKYKTVVFVHGCFWHGHSCPKGTKRPASNKAFWDKKLNGNAARDRRNIAALRKTGWQVVVIWECALDKGTRALMARLNKSTSRGRPTAR